MLSLAPHPPKWVEVVEDVLQHIYCLQSLRLLVQRFAYRGSAFVVHMRCEARLTVVGLATGSRHLEHKEGRGQCWYDERGGRDGSS